MKTINANSPSVTLDRHLDQPDRVRADLHRARRGRPVLMLRYSRKGLERGRRRGRRAGAGARRDPDPGADLLADPMLHLHTLWFILIAVLWVGFFVLEGFDFGVGVLHTIVGRTDDRAAGRDQHDRPLVGRQRGLADRRGRRRRSQRFRTGTRRCSPRCTWRCCSCSAALMVRGVAFEYSGKSDGRALAADVDVVHDDRQPADPAAARGRTRRPARTACRSTQSHEFTGNFFDLLTPYGLWTGLTLLGLCLLHGATFLKLRTTDQVRERARRARAAARLGRGRAGRRLRGLDAASSRGPTCPTRSRSSR